MLVLIEIVDSLLRFVEPADPDLSCLQYFAQLVADEVDDRLEVQLGGDALLDAVDDCELGGALLGLLQQALRFVEQPRVFKRRAK